MNYRTGVKKIGVRIEERRKVGYDADLRAVTLEDAQRLLRYSVLK